MSSTVLDELVIQLGLDTAPLQTNAQQALHLLAALDTQSLTVAKNVEQTSQKTASSVSALQRHAVGLLGFASGGRGLAALTQTLKDAKKPVAPVKSFTQGLKSQKPQHILPRSFSSPDALAGSSENNQKPLKFLTSATQAAKPLDPLTAMLFQEKRSFSQPPFLPTLRQNTALTPVAPSLGRERFVRPLLSSMPHRFLPAHTHTHQIPKRPLVKTDLENSFPEIRPQIVKKSFVSLVTQETALPKKTEEKPHSRVLQMPLTQPQKPQFFPMLSPVMRAEVNRPYFAHEKKHKTQKYSQAGQVVAPQGAGVVTPNFVQKRLSPHEGAERKLPTLRQFPASHFPQTYQARRSAPPKSAAAQGVVASWLPPSGASVGALAAPPYTVPGAMLVQLAHSATPQPAGLSASAANTTYIGPVTISVPSGNPQAIAEALQNMAHQNNHVLASLATRGAV